MTKVTTALAVALAVSAAAAPSSALAFEKKNYQYGNWNKALFSDVVTVTGPAKLIYLAGAGSEEEK